MAAMSKPTSELTSPYSGTRIPPRISGDELTNSVKPHRLNFGDTQSSAEKTGNNVSSGSSAQTESYTMDVILRSIEEEENNSSSVQRVSYKTNLPYWMKGLLAVGGAIISWVLLKPLFSKLISYLKDKYGRND